VDELLVTYFQRSLLLYDSRDLLAEHAAPSTQQPTKQPTEGEVEGRGRKEWEELETVCTATNEEHMALRRMLCPSPNPVSALIL
jgi:hypothetical protein